jgi:hypothetical protein
MGEDADHRPAGLHRLGELAIAQRLDEGSQARQLSLVLRHVRSIRSHGSRFLVDG